MAKGQQLKILLVISDTALEPSLTNTATEIRVTIGINDDFDQILDVTSGILDTEQIAHLHRLWADDAFARDFNRTGTLVDRTSYSLRTNLCIAPNPTL